jgi:hypothetical protein
MQITFYGNKIGDPREVGTTNTKKRPSYLTLGMYEVRFLQETKNVTSIRKMLDTYFRWISLYVGKSKNCEQIVIKYSDLRFSQYALMWFNITFNSKGATFCDYTVCMILIVII